MKFIPAQLAAYLQVGTARRNLRALRGYVLVMLAMVVAYSVVFHLLMAAEGQRHSWLTGLLAVGAELILIGTTDAERRFLQRFGR